MNAVQFLQTALSLLAGAVVFGAAVFVAYVVFVLIRSILQNEHSIRNKNREKGSRNDW